MNKRDTEMTASSKNEVSMTFTGYYKTW